MDVAADARTLLVCFSSGEGSLFSEPEGDGVTTAAVELLGGVRSGAFAGAEEEGKAVVISELLVCSDGGGCVRATRPSDRRACGRRGRRELLVV